jgi:hypothetical protein
MKFPTGLVVSEELKRTPEEDAGDKALLHHRFSLTPAAWDMRNVAGKNYTTSVKDQGSCGSCVSFDTCAALEATLKWIQQNPSLAIDLSEADLFFRGGASCEEGWTLEEANTRLQNHGVGPESCYPYPNGPIKSCIDSNPVKILSSTRITSDAQAKDWLATRGAIQAAMDVPEGLFNYTGGVFKDDGSPVAGQHAVCIVGFDDTKGCWIVKNSWGLGWGEQGWFRIAYGQCGIFRKYAAYGYTVSSAPAPGPQPTPTPTPETGDIVLPVAGVVSIMPGIRGITGLGWSLNGTTRGLIKSLASGFSSLGSFAAGKGLTFGLVYAGKKYHFVSVLPIGATGHIWMVLLGQTSNYTVSFLVKLDVAGENLDTSNEEAVFAAMQLGDDSVVDPIPEPTPTRLQDLATFVDSVKNVFFATMFVLAGFYVTTHPEIAIELTNRWMDIVGIVAGVYIGTRAVNKGKQEAQ